MSFEEAARRRDFTINAIGWDPLEEKYLDPFDGRGDLSRRVLRVVDSATFGDDSLRVLRGVQLAARFELTFDAATRDLCRAIPLDDLPSERIWGEVEKLLLLPRRPSIGLAAALELGVVARLFPEMEALVGCEQEPAWHPEGDVWVHTLLVADEARARVDDLPRHARLAIMLGAICHDFGKPATTAFIDGRIRSLGHEEAGVAPAIALLDRLNIHAIDGYDVRAQVIGLTAHHLKPGAWYKVRDEVGDGAFRRLAQKVDLELLARLAASDCRGPPRRLRLHRDGVVHRARPVARRRARATEADPARATPARARTDTRARASARSCGQVYERQLDGDIRTVEEGLAAAREIIERRERRENPRTED